MVEVMEIQEGFKQTEVGVIPSDWKLVTLEQLTTLIGDGIHATPKYVSNSEIYFVNGNNLVDNKIQVFAVTKCVSKEEYNKYSKSLTEKTLLMSINGTIGNLAFYNNEKVVLGKSACYINIDRKTWRDFIFFQLQTEAIKSFYDNELTGTTIKNLSLKSVRKTLIPLPPTKAEQTAIATALSDADALITQLEKLIAKKRNIKQGAMQELLTGKRRLPGFERKKGYRQTEVGVIPSDWELVSYGKVFDFLTTATYSRSQLSESSEIKYVHYGDIHTKCQHFLDCDKIELPCIKQELLKNYPLVKEGDVIVVDASEDYEGVGKSVEVRNIRESKIISGLHTFLLRDKNGLIANGFKGYIHLNTLVKKQMDTLATGLKVYGVSKTNLKLVQIPVPPTKAEQTRIAQILSDMDTEIEALEKKLEKYKQIKQGMMQNLLTGKIRLI